MAEKQNGEGFVYWDTNEEQTSWTNDRTRANNYAAKHKEIDATAAGAVSTAGAAVTTAQAAVSTANSARSAALTVQAAQSTAITQAAQAKAESAQAVTAATAASQRTGNLEVRTDALEDVAGLGPGDVSDGTVQSLIAQPDTNTRTALDAVIDQGRGGKIVVANHPRFGTPYTKAALVNALNYAESLGFHTILYCPAGVYNVDTGLSLAGYSVQIQGDGADSLQGNPNWFVNGLGGTVFHAPNQNGPVLDYRGWVIPESFLGKVRHGNFTVRGSGVADPTKKNAGIKFDFISSCLFHDISIARTGGPCIEGEHKSGFGVYINDFERIVMAPPIGVAANDVPYLKMVEANGNRFRGIGIRATTNTANCGVSGAFILDSVDSYSAHGNLLDGCWVEQLHVPTGGTIFSFRGHTNTANNTYFVDVMTELNATGTSRFRFLPSPGSNYGGNVVTGTIPGANGISAGRSFSTGIDMQQSGNYVQGVKGYQGGNVTLAPGVERTTVILGGSVQAIDAIGWIDNSGKNTNTLMDTTNGTYILGVHTKVASVPTMLVGGLHAVPKRVFKDPASGAFAVDYREGSEHLYYLRGNVTITSITGAVDGARLTLTLRQMDGAPYAVSWPGNVRWANGGAPTLSGLGQVDVIGLTYESRTGMWREVSRAMTMPA